MSGKVLLRQMKDCMNGEQCLLGCQMHKVHLWDSWMKLLTRLLVNL